LNSAEAKAYRIVQESLAEAEAKRNKILFEAKDAYIKEKNQLEKEMRDRRQELSNIERRFLQKEEYLEQKSRQLEVREKETETTEKNLQQKERELSHQHEEYCRELERISGLTQDQAKTLLLKNLEDEVRFESLKLINKIEEEARRNADKKAKEIVLTAIQRNATEYTSESTVTTVSRVRRHEGPDYRPRGT
jgi:ribonuclease Y